MMIMVDMNVDSERCHGSECAVQGASAAALLVACSCSSHSSPTFHQPIAQHRQQQRPPLSCCDWGEDYDYLATTETNDTALPIAHITCSHPSSPVQLPSCSPHHGAHGLYTLRVRQDREFETRRTPCARVRRSGDGRV